MGDHKRTTSRFGELRRAMMDDGIQLGLSYQDKDLQVLLARAELEGASFVKVTLPSLGRALDKALVSGTFKCPTNFALKPKTRLPKFCYSVFRTILQDDGTLCAEPNLHAIQHLRQFLLFDSKLNSEPSLSTKEKAVQGFFDRMQNLRKFRIDQSHPVLREARKLIGLALKGLDLTNITPGHGPGAVAEKKDRFERWDFSSWPARAEKEYPYALYGTPSFLATLSRGTGIPLVHESETRICLVPKDFRGPRLISAESAVTQYLQQGQMRAMMEYMNHHWLLSRSIRLRDQTFNRAIAQSAFDNSSATLDLSNASDTLSVPLFWYLFAEVPRLRRQLMSTRSQFARYGEKRVRISAFAPMGSAVCFPVETVVFWALAMASVRLHRPTSVPTARKSPRYQTWKEISSQVAVFGDDIVVPTDCLQTLVSTLFSVGCEPNMDKTCWSTPFRESCGGEWFAGTPVTIIRNKRYAYDEKKKIAHYPVLLDLQRKFFLKGYGKTAACLLRLAREIWPVYVRTSQAVPRDANLQETEDDCRFCCGYGYQYSFDTGLPYRFNARYHRLEYRVPTSYQPMKEWGTEGYSRLLARILSDQVDRIAIRDCKVKMAWHFMPAYMGLAAPVEA